MVNINDLISEDVVRGLEQLSNALSLVEWFREYPGNYFDDEQYRSEEWQEFIHEHRDEVVEIFMMKHGETDVRILGPRLSGWGWYQRDLIKIINFLK